MRCLHCGKRLALLRKLRDGQYCSDEHRVQFAQKQEELALARLIEVQQNALRPVPRRPLFAPAQPARRQQSAPEIAWLLPTQVGIQGAPFRMRIPGADPFPFEFLWLYPQHAFTRRTHRLISAGGVTIRLTATSPIASIWRGPDSQAFVAAEAVRWTAAIPSRPPFATGVADARQLPAIPPAARSLPLVPRVFVAEPATVEAVPGAAAATSVRLATALRPAGPAPSHFPSLLAQDPVLRLPDLSTLAKAAPVSWQGLVSAGLLTAEETLPPVPVGLPDQEFIAGLIALTPPALQALASRPGAEWDAIPRTAAPASTIAQPGPRSAALRRCGPKVASLRTPATGSRLPISWMEGAALVSVRYRLPKRKSAQQGSDLGFARRMPLTIPIAGRIRVNQGEPSDPLPTPPFLVAPPISVTALPDFSPPQFPLTAVPLHAVESQATGHRFECPHISRTLEPELALPIGPAPDLDFREPPALPLLTAPGPAAIAPPPAAVLPATAEPLAASDEIVPRMTLSVSAGIAWEPPAAGAGMFRLGVEKIVPRPAGEAPKWLESADWPSPAPVLPSGSKLRSSFAAGSGSDRTFPDWRAWTGPAQLWRQVPAGVRWSAAVMALLVALMFGWNAAGPSTHTVSASTAGAPSFFSGTLRSVKDGIMKRAAISLTDDFRLGLSEWEGEGDWASQWSYDTAGFVRVGSMALYSPSLNLTDYRMEFLGQIERRGMSWAVRAADYKNYYAVKLAITRPGPLPSVSIFRYPVVGGKEGKAIEVPLRIPVRNDTVYRVMMEARGDSYTLAVNGTVVDTWTESRLPKGGIGFYSAKGEKARLRWVGVWHQYDTLGRLCAYLAPLSMPSKDRSINQ